MHLAIEVLGADIGPGNLQFVRYATNEDMLPRDAAEAELKKWTAEGGKALSVIRAIPMKNGSCAFYMVASGVRNCPSSRVAAKCNQDMWLAYCDVPTGKRFLFMGELGVSPNPAQRPLGFVENAAAFERILRSIEFKTSQAKGPESEGKPSEDTLGSSSTEPFRNPENVYRAAIAQEKRTGRRMVWNADGAMVPEPDGYDNPLTKQALAAGWRPLVAEGATIGAGNAKQWTSQALQPGLFRSKTP